MVDNTDDTHAIFGTQVWFDKLFGERSRRGRIVPCEGTGFLHELHRWRIRQSHVVQRLAGTVLADHPIHAILAASDIDRARAWYAERLGLEPIREREGQLLYRIGPSITQFAVEPGFIEKTGIDGNVTRQKIRVAQISALSRDETPREPKSCNLNSISASGLSDDFSSAARMSCLM